MTGTFSTVRAFLSARDAWWAARKIAPVGSTRGRTPTRGGAALKESRWRIAGRAYMSAYKGANGQLIRYPAELVDLVAARIEAIAPKLADAYDRQLGRLADSAWSQWPVDTGLSKSLIDIELEQRGEEFIGRVVSRAPYAMFVDKGEAVRDLLRRPGRLAALQIAADLAEGDDGR